MQREGVARVPVSMHHLNDVVEYILRRCQGKQVLNVGAAGNVERYFDDNLNQWLHHRLGSIAAKLIGVDIDSESVAFARQRGVANLVEADCVTMRLAERFDVIVISEVLEHVEAAGQAFRNLLDHLVDGGEIVLTTPNPTYLMDVVRAFLGRAPAVYYDHVGAFFPENFAALCERCGATIIAGGFFTFYDYRPGYRLKSRILAYTGRWLPRLHGSFVLVIQRKF